jgi:hypothetical protein
MPSSSASTSRVRWYTPRASAWRPDRYKATISNPPSRSRVGWAATNPSSSPTSPACPPAATPSSTRASTAASRSSSNRAASA